MPDHVKRAHDNAFKPFDPHEEDSDTKEEQERPSKKSRSEMKEGKDMKQESQASLPPPRVSEDLKQQYDRVRVRMVKNPIKPSAREVAEHMLTHTPFRSWCPHCVAGQAGIKGHYKKAEEEHQEVPTVHVDYMFMNSEDCHQEEIGEDRGMPILVMSDQDTGMCFSSVVPKKGVSSLCNHEG